MISGAVLIHVGWCIEPEVLEPGIIGFGRVDGSSTFSSKVGSARTWRVGRVGRGSKGPGPVMVVELHGRGVGRGYCLGGRNQGDDLCHFERRANEFKSESTGANANLHYTLVGVQSRLSTGVISASGGKKKELVWAWIQWGGYEGQAKQRRAGQSLGERKWELKFAPWRYSW